MSYFRYLPKVYVRNRTIQNGVHPYELTVNIFRRIKIRDELQGGLLGFTQYEIGTGERPDQVADTMYDDPTLDWVVLTTNNIIHVRDEWPMGNQDFLTYLNDKYTDEELSNIHHYETEVVRDSNGKLIQLSGITVPEGHSVTFVDNGVLRTESKITSFSFLEHETNLNDAKRDINILRPEYLNLFLEEFGDIMEYKPSRQFVNKNLKKTENPRIISP